MPGDLCTSLSRSHKIPEIKRKIRLSSPNAARRSTVEQTGSATGALVLAARAAWCRPARDKDRRFEVRVYPLQFRSDEYDHTTPRECH